MRPAKHRSTHRLSPIVLVALLAALPYLAYRFTSMFFAPLGWDQSWLLYCAQHVVRGVQLYGPRLVETNPPGMIWFSIPPVLVSDLLHSSPAAALRLLTLLLLMLSTAWSIRLARVNRTTANVNFLALLACALLLVAFDLTPDDFGQREHLFLFLSLPYIVATGIRDPNKLRVVERVGLGVAAGMGICLKPQEALVLVAVEAYLILRRRSIRRLVSPEVIAVVATGALYVLLVRIITPQYFKNILPLLLNTYWAYGEGTALVLASRVKRYILEFLVTCIACFLLQRRIRLPDAVGGLLAGSAGAFAAYCVQHTHWPYHRYPLQELLQLAWAFLLLVPAAEVAGEPGMNSRLQRTVAALALVPVALYAALMTPRIRALAASRPAPDELSRFFAQFKPGDTVYIFSTRVTPFSDVFEHRLNWGSRFVHLWTLPAIVKNQTGPIAPYEPFKRLSNNTLAHLSTLQRSETAEDLDYWRPSVVLVERCTVQSDCQAIHGRTFDILAWFLQSPQFQQAWSHYQRQPDMLWKFDVYARVR